ncbi:MAG: glycosyltransferase family 2 protein [Flavobacteriaceae bacterium]|nr:glycosyltransferase family 2 protein [Flavobacteriaceae bacterium]
MKLSVVILNYNVRYFLEQCIRSVQKSIITLDAEIIVIDNDSSDDSCQMVKEIFPEILLIENKDNVGFSKANNQAVKEAKGEYVCILNPDTAVSEHTFISALKHAETINDLGALGVYLMDGTGAFLPESKRNLPTPKASLLKLLGIGRDYYANHISKEERGKVDILVGAFMLLKRSVYNEVNGFDEDYFMYGEDIDFSYKITKAGYSNHYMGDVTVMHYKGESTQKDKAYFDRFYGAMKIFYSKHFYTNIFFNAFVNLGVFIAKSTKKAAVKVKDSNTNANKETFLLTENLTLLRSISSTIDVPIKSVSKSMFADKTFSDSHFIFDANYMSFDQIFRVMKDLSGHGNTFRIHPPDCNFIIGSDQSDQKGAVTVFS